MASSPYPMPQSLVPPASAIVFTKEELDGRRAELESAMIGRGFAFERLLGTALGRAAARHANASGLTPWMIAARDLCPEQSAVLQGLAKHSDLRAQDRQGRTALHWAAATYVRQAGLFEATDEIDANFAFVFVARHSDVLTRDSRGETALTRMAKKGVVASGLLDLLEAVAQGKAAPAMGAPVAAMEIEQAYLRSVDNAAIPSTLNTPMEAAQALGEIFESLPASRVETLARLKPWATGSQTQGALYRFNQLPRWSRPAPDAKRRSDVARALIDAADIAAVVAQGSQDPARIGAEQKEATERMGLSGDAPERSQGKAPEATRLEGQGAVDRRDEKAAPATKNTPRGGRRL